jgi:hypothetical protein
MNTDFKEYPMFTPAWYTMLGGIHDRSKGQYDNPYDSGAEPYSYEAYETGWHKEDYYINKEGK